MKKVLLKISLSVFCVLFATVIFAQEQKGNIEFGVKGGLNLSHMNKASFKIHPGIHAGVFAEYTLNNFLGIQGELLYSMMGAKENYSAIYLEESYDAEETYKNNYIVLPVLAKLYVTKSLSLDLGPQFGYMVSAKVKRNIDGTSEFMESGTFDYYDGVDNKFDTSFAIGLSYKLGNRFDISGRCNLGLTKLDNGYNSKNNVFQFGIGYRFK